MDQLARSPNAVSQEGRSQSSRTLANIRIANVSAIWILPRVAVNPLNAIFNYLYTILETETRLAIAAMGLDPGLGFLHVDNDRRDSLACDLMEVVRPDVDAFLFDWVSRTPFKRELVLRAAEWKLSIDGKFRGDPLRDCANVAASRSSDR